MENESTLKATCLSFFGEQQISTGIYRTTHDVKWPCGYVELTVVLFDDLNLVL